MVKRIHGFLIRLRSVLLKVRQINISRFVKKLTQASIILLATLASIFTVFTGVLALQNVSSFNEWFNKEFGTREYWLSAVNSLAPEVNVSYFDKKLGSPIYTSSIDGLRNRTYVNEYFYTQVFVADDGSVRLFSVTLRKADFYPEIPYLRNSSNGPYLLGKTTFGDLSGSASAPIVAAQYLPGARRGIYSETYYFGNPGNYLYYFLSINDAGIGNAEYAKLEGSDTKAFSFEDTGMYEDCEKESLASPGDRNNKANVSASDIRGAREQMSGVVANTFTVTSRGGMVICDYKDFFKEQGVFILGPNLDKVPLLRGK